MLNESGDRPIREGAERPRKAGAGALVEMIYKQKLHVVYLQSSIIARGRERTALMVVCKRPAYDGILRTKKQQVTCYDVTLIKYVGRVPSPLEVSR